MPYIIATIPGCICGEADDPNDHRADCPSWGREPASQAVATLDEARHTARNLVEDEANLPGNDWTSERVALREDARNLPESGGTIGPLPDGTMIEVREVRWFELADATGYSPEATRWPKSCAKIIAAYNAAHA